MLKEMIERKRRNDFVRKREFDMLRKMRSRDVLAARTRASRPSFFQSSLPSKPDDRASTLKKIDEIEAQMSMQWWKTKGADSPPAPARVGHRARTLAGRRTGTSEARRQRARCAYVDPEPACVPNTT
jgi:hypothetical protein